MKQRIEIAFRNGTKQINYGGCLSYETLYGNLTIISSRCGEGIKIRRVLRKTCGIAEGEEAGRNNCKLGAG